MPNDNVELRNALSDLPTGDNTPSALKRYRDANAVVRGMRWPAPFDTTTHVAAVGDARDISWLADESVHLIVTSPPYWVLKAYRDHPGQMGAINDYEAFLDELDQCWAECARVLVPGGRICCVVGDVCLSRKTAGRHYVMPLHADIQVRARRLNLDCLSPILWNKIANGITEAVGNGAGFYGKPYQPNAIVKNDLEYILFLRKGGAYRKVTPVQKALSMLTKEEMQAWWQPFWTDIKGASTRNGHPAPYPVALAERLIRMFSFAGDTVLDPFAGTCSTAVAAFRAGRNSVSNEIDPVYLKTGLSRLQDALRQGQLVGAVSGIVQELSASETKKEARIAGGARQTSTGI